MRALIKLLGPRLVAAAPTCRLWIWTDYLFGYRLAGRWPVLLFEVGPGDWGLGFGVNPWCRAIRFRFRHARPQ